MKTLSEKITPFYLAIMALVILLALSSCSGISNYYLCPTYGHKAEPIKKKNPNLKKHANKKHFHK